jgi:hypothetical protein
MTYTDQDVQRAVDALLKRAADEQTRLRRDGTPADVYVHPTRGDIVGPPEMVVRTVLDALQDGTR